MSRAFEDTSMVRGIHIVCVVNVPIIFAREASTFSSPGTSQTERQAGDG